MCGPTSCCAWCGPAGQRWLEAFNCIVALVFCVGMVWYGWQIVDTSLMLDEHSSSASAVPDVDLLQRAAGGRRC